MLVPLLSRGTTRPQYSDSRVATCTGSSKKLDYLQDLGVTAIYFCPIFASAANHRYHTYDYFNVDPLLGGNDALRSLIDEAHRREMRIVLDGVFNHAGRGFWQFHHVLENGAASPFRDWFHFDPEFLNGQKRFQPYPSEEAAEKLSHNAGSYETIGYSGWWNLPALPKFNTDCPEARRFLFSVAEHWVRFGIDGWRLDVPNEIDDDEFWREFRRRVRDINSDTYIVGEVWGAAQRWLQGDMWDAVMNYQITAACLGFFGGANLDLNEVQQPSSFRHVQQMPSDDFVAEVRRINESVPPEITAVQMNLLDSHDMPRFLTCCSGDKAALQMAWLFLCAMPGAPCIYYGDEVGLDGRHDPDCRKGFPWRTEDQDGDMHKWYQQCIRLRRDYQLGRSAAPQPVLTATDVVVFEAKTDSGQLFFAFNVGSDGATFELATDLESDVSVVFANGKSETDRVNEHCLDVTLGPRCSAVLGSA